MLTSRPSLRSAARAASCRPSSSASPTAGGQPAIIGCTLPL